MMPRQMTGSCANAVYGACLRRYRILQLSRFLHAVTPYSFKGSSVGNSYSLSGRRPSLVPCRAFLEEHPIVLKDKDLALVIYGTKFALLVPIEPSRV